MLKKQYDSQKSLKDVKINLNSEDINSTLPGYAEKYKNEY